MSKLHRRDFLLKASVVCGAGAAMTAVPVAAEQAVNEERTGGEADATSRIVRPPELDELRERLLAKATLRAFTWSL